jgi:hypothetical protein
MKTSRIRSRRTTLLVLLAAIALPLHAVDGVVLINQNTALAGNVTPGDSPGFPVTISTPGSYKLSGNLTVPDANTTAIQVSADNVTIDLNGFSILGPVVCTGFPVTSCTPTGSGVGITNAPLDTTNITVRNGVVRGMGAVGIALGEGGIRVEGIRATNNGIAGISVASGIVTSCEVTQNGGLGISQGAVIMGNVVRGNASDGIQTASGVVTNNFVFKNGGNGIEATFSSVSGNEVRDSGQAGIRAGCPSSVVGNTAVGNIGGDIFTAGPGCTRANNAPAP